MGETNSMKDLGLFITTVGAIPIDKTMIGILCLKSLSSSFNTVVVNFKLNCYVVKSDPYEAEKLKIESHIIKVGIGLDNSSMNLVSVF